MNKKWLVGLAVTAIAASGMAYAQGAHKYVGVKKCSMCHKSESKGNQFGQWSSTKHAKAYETLATPAAQEAATKAGVSGNPQEAAQCLKCHITGAGQESSWAESFVKTDGVQCESCHGAGSDYMAISVMKDKEKAIAAGLVMPTKDVCVKCHNPESPTYKDFNYDEYLKKVAHPAPKS